MSRCALESCNERRNKGTGLMSVDGPRVGQGIPGVSLPPPNYGPEGRMSFSRFLVEQDRIFERAGETFADIAPYHLAHVAPAFLFASLVGAGVVVDRDGRGKQAVMFPQANGRLRPVALSLVERKLLPDHIEAYGRGAHRKTADSQTRRIGLASYDTDAPRRAIGHALIPKIEELQTYKDTTLADQEKILKQFIEGTTGRNVGLARMGTEGKLRLRASLLFEQILPDALDAIGDQRLWAPEQKKLAERTITARTVHFRGGNAHVGYANKVCRMLFDYNLIKQRVFENRIERAEAYLAANGIAKQTLGK